MTQLQLAQIKKFSREFYPEKDQFHGFDHALMVKKYALRFAKNYPKVNRKALEAACYLHDIGRSMKDEGHPEESAKLAKPFLEKINLTREEIGVIIDAVINHDKSKILNAITTEARLLFDADKVLILTVFGFIRVSFFLVEERRMKMKNAIKFLWQYAEEVREKYIYTDEAKAVIDKDLGTVEEMVKRFLQWG